MGKTVNKNVTDTAISGVSALDLSRGLVNYGADFRTKQNDPQEAVVVNMTSPLSFPEKFRFGRTEIANVYKGTGIDPAFYPPSRQGLQLLVQLSDTWTVTDSTDPTYQIALPVSAHMIIKVPNSEFISAADVEGLVGRLVSGLYETGSETTERLSALMRGSLLPKDI